jgi:hypothetical protein
MGVIFMAVATAAPITAMVGNVPIAVGFGNGSHAPAGYIVATIVLGLFAVGYATMAKHITATGAFYGYISHGLGRVVGMASGLLITMAYVVFEASLIGIFSFFFKNFLSSQFGVEIHWILPALLMLALNAILTFFDVNLTAKVLGVFLVTEIFMLSLGAFAVLFQGGGPERCLHTRGHRGRQRRARSVLRVLVLGRFRVDGDVRRGVQGSEADHPARHAAQRLRRRHLLRLRVVDGDRGHRAAAVHRPRAEC